MQYTGWIDLYMVEYKREEKRVIIPRFASYENATAKIIIETNDVKVLRWFDEHLEDFIRGCQDDLREG